MAGATLLSNLYGEVTRAEDGSIRCTCTGSVVSALLLTGGSVFLVAGLAAGIALPGARAAALLPPVVMASALLALGLGRRRRHGLFTVDPAAGTLTQARGHRVLGSHRIGDLRGPRLSRDLTDGMSLGPVLWLEVEAGGRWLRLAKGKRAELQPVLAALAAAGIRGGG